VPTEQRLSEALSAFARTLATDFPIQRILDHLVERIVDVLPVDAAGVTLISPTTVPRFIAASDETAMTFQRLQTDLGEGPCLAAYETASPIAIPDLSRDDRFPTFAQHALVAGLVAVFTFPLRDSESRIGALDLYRKAPGPLDPDEMAAAQTLADVATAYLLNAQERADLKHASETERAALEKLRALDQAKTEFVATVIHELRTPMTSISSYTELLQDEATGTLSTRQQKFVAAIRRNSDRLTVLVNDLLTLSSLEPGTLSPEQEDLDLRAVVQSTHAALVALLDSEHLEVSFEVPPDPVVVHGDARHLERMITNLVTNAVKFTDAGGRVSCTLQVVEGKARVKVSDTGIGIPEAEQDKLFTRFFRSSTAQEHAIPGSGLGLTIVDSIVRSHGGTISLVSAHMEGTTVTVDLPLRSSRPGRSRLAPPTRSLGTVPEG
jgi:signal transduction histidine kinase